ncbi:hypothetical protein B0H19DRAFT_1060350 [Mycena capillaripes]|nr:hypothetical protein B0H19DRAFT_1060350 [Mycena capillaripes]
MIKQDLKKICAFEELRGNHHGLVLRDSEPARWFVPETISAKIRAGETDWKSSRCEYLTEIRVYGATRNGVDTVAAMDAVCLLNGLCCRYIDSHTLSTLSPRTSPSDMPEAPDPRAPRRAAAGYTQTPIPTSVPCIVIELPTVSGDNTQRSGGWRRISRRCTAHMGDFPPHASASETRLLLRYGWDERKLVTAPQEVLRRLQDEINLA